MTHLQQTCHYMLDSQEKLQRLYKFEQVLPRTGDGRTLAMVHSAQQTHEYNLKVMGAALQLHPAANDPAPPEGRAA